MSSQPPFDLKSYLERMRSQINKALNNYVARFCPSNRMAEPVSYALTAGGKRVRPILCMASCHAVGGHIEDALAVACALEMIHTYSLIHDDLPALDNDDLRRGQPTCHVKFNEATAVLSGDALLTMAFEVIATEGAENASQNGEQWLNCLNVVSQAAGCRGMIEGQARDLAYEGRKIDRQSLEQMHQLKTGALIKASVVSGAIMGKGSEDQIKKLSDYARNIGLAFQVVDDILNIKGDPSVLGKAVGTDASRQKNTYPALLGLPESEAYALQLVESALQALSIFDNKADPLRAIARYIIERKR